MKKIFTLMFLLLVCVTMSAATTVLFEGSKALNWEDGVNIEGSSFADAVAGDVLIVTTENGGCKLSINYPWETIVESSETTTQYVITEDKLSDIQSSGIKVQGGEDVNLLKVELSTVAPQPAEKKVVATLLDTPATIGNWDNTIEVAGQAIVDAGAKAGDFIRINYSTTGDAQLQLSANSPTWHNILDCVDLNASKTLYDVELTEEMITDFAADKLYVQGKNIIVSSVQLVREETSSVSSVSIEKKIENTIYGIDGKRLGSKPQHGIYIMNGKKFMVR